MVGSVDNILNSPFDKMRYSSRCANFSCNKTNFTEHTATEIPKSDELITESGTNDSNITLGSIDKEIIDTVVQPQKNSKQRIRAGLIVGASAFALGGLTYALSKGKIVKFGSKIINKISEKISKKIEKLDAKDSLTTLESVYYSSLQHINAHAVKARGTVLNFTPIKDSLFSKLVKEKLKLNKPCDRLSNSFRKLSFGTVKSNYQRSSKSISKMLDTFSEINARIVSGEYSHIPGPKNEVLNSIEENTNRILSVFNSNFTEKALRKRSQQITKKLDGLDKKVYDSIYGDLKGFFKENTWSTFIPEELVKNDKQQFIHNIMSQKKIITNTPQDNFTELQEILSELTQNIDVKNSESLYTLRYLKQLAKNYVKLSGPNESIARQEIVAKINSLIKDSKKSINSHPYSQDSVNKINDLLNKFGTIVNTDKKGAIEALLTIYKQILPPEEYQRIKKVAKKAVNSINKSAKSEGFDYFDKLRDLAVGSALTDVSFGIAIPLASSAVAMSTADTKEKKRSVALKYAIPIFVGIGTCMTCTMKLIAGGKALFAGALSSIGTNQIGEFIDNKIRKNDQNLAEQSQEPKQTTILNA